MENVKNKNIVNRDTFGINLFAQMLMEMLMVNAAAASKNNKFIFDFNYDLKKQ